MSARRPPFHRVLTLLDACREARVWVAEQDEIGLAWEDVIVAACEPAFFEAAGSDWLEWLLIRLHYVGHLRARDALRAEVRVWRALPELHPHFPPGALDALDAWELGVLASDRLPEGPLPRLYGPSNTPTGLMRVNNRNIQRTIRDNTFGVFSGTWYVNLLALRHIHHTLSEVEAAAARMARAICDEHGPVVLRALESFAAVHPADIAKAPA